MEHSKFTDIGQFRNVIKAVQQSAQFVKIDEDGLVVVNINATMPTIRFHGSTKIHGTNSGVAQNPEKKMWYLGRNHNVTVENDNAGFAFFAESHKEVFKKLFNKLYDLENLMLDKKTVIIYGEWCGKGIQKGVAINELPKMFVIFAIKVQNESKENKESYYLDRTLWKDLKSPEDRIFNINDYPSFDIDIEFGNPSEAQNKLVEITEQVEKECPVGKAFGISGIGEGVVWEGNWNNARYIFKVKGEKHSSSKVKKTAHVDVEKVNSIKEFVEYAVTENRLNQAIEQVFITNSLEPSRKGTGEFLRWVVKDVHKEEMDTMLENNLEPKDVNGMISDKARTWFFNKLDEGIGL